MEPVLFLLGEKILFLAKEENNENNLGLTRKERNAMSIRSTLVPTLMAVTAIATLAIQVGPAFAQEGFTPCTGNKKPSYYSGDGGCHTGRPSQLPAAVTPAQQNDWLLGGSNH
jgi:hypothetical protein